MGEKVAIPWPIRLSSLSEIWKIIGYYFVVRGTGAPRRAAPKRAGNHRTRRQMTAEGVSEGSALSHIGDAL